MVLVERVEYVLTSEILDDAVKAVLPDFVPPATPQHSPQLLLKLLAGAGGFLGLLILGIDLEMPAEHFIVAGLGVALCLLIAAVPWICRAINRGLVRFTSFAQTRIRDRLSKTADPAVGTIVRWEFDQDGFRTEMLAHTRRFAWTDLKRIRTREKFWLLNVKVNELFLPAVTLTDPARDFIRRKAAEAGVKFVGR